MSQFTRFTTESGSVYEIDNSRSTVYKVNGESTSSRMRRDNPFVHYTLERGRGAWFFYSFDGRLLQAAVTSRVESIESFDRD